LYLCGADEEDRRVADGHVGVVGTSQQLRKGEPVGGGGGASSRSMGMSQLQLCFLLGGWQGGVRCCTVLLLEIGDRGRQIEDRRQLTRQPGNNII
jgi:hypothetical protein